MFRRAVEGGEVEVIDLDEAYCGMGLRAAVHRLPFLPWRGGVGTSFAELNPSLVAFDDPIAGDPQLAISAFELDVALVSAERSDPYGNVQVIGTPHNGSAAGHGGQACTCTRIRCSIGSRASFGDTVVVLGAGQRGLACVIAARAAGAGTVMSLTGGRGADVVVDVTPVATQPILDAIEVVRYGGTIVLAGVKGGPLAAIDNDQIVFKSITVRGVFTVTSPAYREAIRMLAAGALPFARLHTASYGLERAEEAIHHLAGRLDGPPAVNVAIAPGGVGSA